MRKLYTLLFIALLASSAAKAQSPYRPLPTSDAFWLENHDFYITSYNDCAESFFFGTDTIINNTTYHRVYSNQDCYASQPQYEYSYRLRAHIRQDSIAKKIYWLYDLTNNIEGLLYDFNLTVGMPYPQTISNVYYPVPMVVGLDSVLMPDGYHRSWQVDVDSSAAGTYIVSVIEGMGTDKSLLYCLFDVPFEDHRQTLCFSKNHTVMYHPNPASWNPCHIVGVNEAAPAAQLTITPNPSSEKVNIIWPAPQFRLGVSLYDSQGRLVRSVSEFSGMHLSFDISELPAGIYFLRSEKGDKYSIEKIVKE